MLFTRLPNTTSPGQVTPGMNVSDLVIMRACVCACQPRVFTLFISPANLRLGALLDLHTEAVQAALAKYKERKMPMPSKRRSVLVQSSVEACTPPGEWGFGAKTA